MARRFLLPVALIAVLALVAGLPASAQSWAGRGRAQGIVKDEAGNPIEGAKVTLRMAGSEEGPEPLYTNEKGRWSYLGLSGGAWAAVIEKEGFVTAQGPVRVSEFGAAPTGEVVLKANPYASIDVGDALLAEGKYAEARAEYEKAFSGLEPEPAARLRSRIGDTYLQEGNYAAARAEYEQALTAIPDAEAAHIRLQMASSYQAESNFAAAREQFERVLPLLPPEGQAQVLLMVARTYDTEENRDGAIQALERAVELEPDNAAILQLLADLLSRAGRDDEAEAYMARIPEDAELPPDMLLNAGIRHYNDGSMDEAMTHFDRAIAQNPDLADAYYYRGLVHLGKGANAEALADLNKLVELDPDNPLATEAREFISFLEDGE